MAIKKITSLISLCRYLNRPEMLIDSMLRPRVANLPNHIQRVFIQNLMKVYAAALVKFEGEEKTDTAVQLTNTMVEKLPIFVQSSNLEVQERVRVIQSKKTISF